MASGARLRLAQGGGFFAFNHQVLHRDFEMGVLVLIVGSSTCLALDHPLDPPTSLKAQVLGGLDLIFFPSPYPKP